MPPKHGSINLYRRPRKPEGSLGRTAQDVHLDSHRAPELWVQKPGRHCLLYRRAAPASGWQAASDWREGVWRWGAGGDSGPVTRASLHSSPATIRKKYLSPSPSLCLHNECVCARAYACRQAGTKVPNYMQ